MQISNLNLEPPMKWSILDHFCTGANIGSANGQMSNYYLCSVRLADLIRTTNAMVVLFSLAEFSLSLVL